MMHSNTILRTAVFLALLTAALPAWGDETVKAVLELRGSFLYAGDPIQARLSIGNEGEEVVSNPVKAGVLKGFFARTADGKAIRSTGKTTAKEPARPAELKPMAFYGTIVDLEPGENTVDDWISDDGGSVATLTSESLTGPLFQAGSELLATVEVTDLEAGEQVAVRIDVKLFCDPGSNTCEECVADGDCPVGEVCEPTSQTCRSCYDNAIAPLFDYRRIVIDVKGKDVPPP